MNSKARVSLSPSFQIFRLALTTALWTLDNKLFMDQRKSQTFLAAPPPYLFQGVEDREPEPTKKLRLRLPPFTCSAGGPQVNARLLGSQNHSAPLFDHQLFSLPVCFSGLVSCPVH